MCHELRGRFQTAIGLPVNLYDHLDQIIYISVNQPFPTFLFSHEGIIHVNVTLKVKAVVMLLIWIASITI